MQHFEKLESYIPVNLLSVKGLLLSFLVIYGFILIRYFLMVAPFYFHFLNKKSNLTSSSLADLPSSQIKSEIKYSVISSFIFAFAGVILGILWQSDLSLMYLKFDEYGYWYLPLSFVLVTLAHEVYFYGTHRWMHQKSVFKIIHKVHHDSKNLSPWASFSFHPYEALILAAFLPLITLVIPLHPVVLISYMVFMTITAISNHLGHELIGNKFFLKHFISGTHHSYHHKFYNHNFGLYFCFMDRMFKTEHNKKEL